MRLPAMACVVALSLVSCAGGEDTSVTTTLPVVATTEEVPGPPVSTPEVGSTAPVTTTTTLVTTTSANLFSRPDWLGTRRLPLRDDGHGEALPTPPELVDRRLETRELLAPPLDDSFQWSAGPVSVDVLARSSWNGECPVGVEELTYLTMTHYGFDGRFHTGEMIVNSAVAEDVVEVFRILHESRFPIEQMRVITAAEVDAHPTGDFNDTTSFVCRPVVGSVSWSQHAYGLAIDINPFHNPYVKGDLVLPELASAYVDREKARPGMIREGDIVTKAFDAIGWGWGGRWSSLDDWMHFSRNGR